MIAETLFSAELLRAYSTQKFRDHAARQPDRMADRAGGRPDRRSLIGIGVWHAKIRDLIRMLVWTISTA
jgi:hypothetical protein